MNENDYIAIPKYLNNEITEEQYNGFKQFADEQVRTIEENADFFQEGEANQPESPEQSEENELKEQPKEKPEQGSIFGKEKIETAQQSRLNKLQEQLKDLPPAQQNLARKAIEECEKRISKAQNQTNKYRKQLEKARKDIIREYNKDPKDREQIKRGGIIFDVLADLSKEELDMLKQ